MPEMPLRACRRTERRPKRRPCAARSTGCSLASSRRVRHRPRRRGWRHGLHIFRTGLGQFVSKQEWLPKRETSRIVCTILEVIIRRQHRQNSLVVIGPWNDLISAQYGPPPCPGCDQPVPNMAARLGVEAEAIIQGDRPAQKPHERPDLADDGIVATVSAGSGPITGDPLQANCRE